MRYLYANLLCQSRKTFGIYLSDETLCDLIDIYICSICTSNAIVTVVVIDT